MLDGHTRNYAFLRLGNRRCSAKVGAEYGGHSMLSLSTSSMVFFLACYSYVYIFIPFPLTFPSLLPFDLSFFASIDPFHWYFTSTGDISSAEFSSSVRALCLCQSQCSTTSISYHVSQ